MKTLIKFVWLLLVVVLCTPTSAQTADPEFYSVPCNRTITADIVALDQMIWYNRFGARDPHGMIFALASDVIPISPGSAISPGNVRLKSNKRPRPLVLRANVGDCLEITLTNLLS
ncbi:MAG TPA: hypothetical protein EYN40_06625, partial [Planctomycetes bacterium]|nr:hypothetical protein [Planctomycetota bacterium]